MQSEKHTDSIAEDTFQETVTQYASKLLGRGAKALRGVASDARALAGAAADRAAHFKSMLVNLDTLNTSVYQQLSSLESSKLSRSAHMPKPIVVKSAKQRVSLSLRRKARICRPRWRRSANILVMTVPAWADMFEDARSMDTTPIEFEMAEMR
jgi:hypothetical protein